MERKIDFLRTAVERCEQQMNEQEPNKVEHCSYLGLLEARRPNALPNFLLKANVDGKDFICSMFACEAFGLAKSKSWTETVNFLKSHTFTGTLQLFKTKEGRVVNFRKWETE